MRDAAGQLTDGLEPLRLPQRNFRDLAAITGGLVPELRRRGVFRDAYQESSLRGLLGLARPANRYATA